MRRNEKRTRDTGVCSIGKRASGCMGSRPWNTGEVKRLIELRRQRLTCREIGVILGRSLVAIEQMCKRNQIPRTTEAERWRDAFALGLTSQQTADVMGTTIAMVRCWRYKLKQKGFAVQNVPEADRVRNWRESKFGVAG